MKVDVITRDSLHMLYVHCIYIMKSVMHVFQVLLVLNMSLVSDKQC